MKSKFNFGDMVIGNRKASEHYGITRGGTEWVVINPTTYRDNGKAMIVIANIAKFKEILPEFMNDPNPYSFTLEHYEVREDCFDFVKPIIQLPNKEYSHVLERYDN